MCVCVSFSLGVFLHHIESILGDFSMCDVNERLKAIRSFFFELISKYRNDPICMTRIQESMLCAIMYAPAHSVITAEALLVLLILAGGCSLSVCACV